MKTVRDLLQVKGYSVWAVAPDTSVYDALALMAQKNVGAVLVIQDDRPVGIMSERDYARKVILRGKFSQSTPVSEIMTEKVLCIGPEQTVQECMALMTDKHVRHLPVLQGEQLIGVISIGDVVKAIISEQEFTIEQLENYITGSALRPRRPDGWR
jgi:CBS domain-containing protein